MCVIFYTDQKGFCFALHLRSVSIPVSHLFCLFGILFIRQSERLVQNVLNNMLCVYQTKSHCQNSDC